MIWIKNTKTNEYSQIEEFEYEMRKALKEPIILEYPLGVHTNTVIVNDSSCYCAIGYTATPSPIYREDEEEN